MTNRRKYKTENLVYVVAIVGVCIIIAINIVTHNAYYNLLDNFNANIEANNKLQSELDAANDIIKSQRQEIQDLLEIVAKQDKYYISEITLSKHLQEFLYEETLKYENVTYEEALAVMMTENPSFDTNALNYNTNGTVDTGLFQINTVNQNRLSKELGITDLTDPYQNIRAGVYILNSLNYEGHQKYMSYNMGEGRAKRKILNGILSTTYSNKVITAIKTINDLM